jgi:N-methylhydantoinase B
VLNPDTEAVELSSKETVELKPGDVISFRTCGGGGYGPPQERDLQLVLSDVRNGKVSVQRAREVYRVAIDVQKLEVDGIETAKLRG